VDETTAETLVAMHTATAAGGPVFVPVEHGIEQGFVTAAAAATAATAAAASESDEQPLGVGWTHAATRAII
jgi:hypothetical protein